MRLVVAVVAVLALAGAALGQPQVGQPISTVYDGMTVKQQARVDDYGARCGIRIDGPTQTPGLHVVAYTDDPRSDGFKVTVASVYVSGRPETEERFPFVAIVFPTNRNDPSEVADYVVAALGNDGVITHVFTARTAPDLCALLYMHLSAEGRAWMEGPHSITRHLA